MKFWWTQNRELRDALRLQNEQFEEERNVLKAAVELERMKRSGRQTGGELRVVGTAYGNI